MVMSSVSALLSLVLTIASQESAGTETPSPAKCILALNLTTLDLCANAAQIFKKNTGAEHPFFPAWRRSKRREFRSSVS